MKRSRNSTAAPAAPSPVLHASALSSLLSPELQAQLGVSDGVSGGGGDAVMPGSRKKKQVIKAAIPRGALLPARKVAPVPKSRVARRAEKSVNRNLASLQVRSPWTCGRVHDLNAITHAVLN